jgi:hypothetical protein
VSEEKKIVYPSARGRMGPCQYPLKPRRVPRSVKQAERAAYLATLPFVPLAISGMKQRRRR